MRVETVGNATLYLGDAREILPTLQPVSTVFTDPPFGVRSEEWDAMDEHEMAAFTMLWLSHARRLSEQIVTFCLRDDAITGLCKMLFPRVREMIWHKPLGSQYASSSEARLWYSYESILHCYIMEEPKDREIADAIRKAREQAGLSRGAVDIAVRGKKTGLCYRWEEAACLPTEQQVAILKTVMELGPNFDAALKLATTRAHGHSAEKADVFIYPTVATYGHPCEKPVLLLEDLLTSVLKDCSSILDPFMGVGSAGVACMNHGRRYTGIEIDPKYFEIACSRIEAAQAQGRLFA